VWIPYTFQAGTTAGYKIYRSINMQGGPPGTFSHVATVGSVVEWTDFDLAAGSAWKVYYKVKAYKNSPYTESDFTNIAESGAAGFQKESLSASEKPDEFQLEQCYPNPFNPSTNIKYSIKENSMVSIKIYDILGREMKTLVNKSHPAGIYNIKFDAAELAVGIYIYKIQAGDFTASRKMNLIK
jgi:hypothetical protein